MFAIVSFVVGLAGGAAGTAAWLLSEPGEPRPVPESLGARLETVKTRLDDAVAEGKRAGAETENRLRLQLEAYRRNPDRPAADSLR